MPHKIIKQHKLYDINIILSIYTQNIVFYYKIWHKTWEITNAKHGIACMAQQQILLQQYIFVLKTDSNKYMRKRIAQMGNKNQICRLRLCSLFGKSRGRIRIVEKRKEQMHRITSKLLPLTVSSWILFLQILLFFRNSLFQPLREGERDYCLKFMFEIICIAYLYKILNESSENPFILSCQAVQCIHTHTQEIIVGTHSIELYRFRLYWFIHVIDSRYSFSLWAGSRALCRSTELQAFD